MAYTLVSGMVEAGKQFRRVNGHQPQDQRNRFAGPSHQANRKRGCPKQTEQRPGDGALAVV
jgi:hypothetical protein